MYHQRHLTWRKTLRKVNQAKKNKQSINKSKAIMKTHKNNAKIQVAA